MQEAERRELNELSYQIIAAAIEVHRTLGPGLLESVYRTCMLHELKGAGLEVTSEQAVPIKYKGLILEDRYRLDLLIEQRIVVELKCVEKILPVHGAQLLSYLRLTNTRLGLLINFNEPRVARGIRRLING